METQKKDATRGWWRWLLLGSILAFSLVAAYSTAQVARAEDIATAPPARAAWLMGVQFQGTTISATLLITAQVGMATYEQTVDISASCIPKAGAVISMSQAIMGATGYLQCQMPDLSAQVADMTGGALILPAIASCPANGHSWGQGFVSTGPFVTGGINPLFSHPDIRYEIPFVGGGAPALTVLHLALNNYHIHSTPFRPRTPWNGIRTDLICNGVNCGSRHWANGHVRGTSSSPAPTVTMSTSSVPVYIGYDPVSQQNLSWGKIYQLDVDPGCSMVGN